MGPMGPGPNSGLCGFEVKAVWSFEGWVLLRILLKMAVHSFWSDLEKLPKSASGEIL